MKWKKKKTDMNIMKNENEKKECTYDETRSKKFWKRLVGSRREKLFASSFIIY